MIKFSSLFSDEKPANLFILPSFPSPTLESDGVHLSPYSGFEYVISLFDSAEEVFKASKRSTPAALSHQSESIRSLEDRVVVIEQDHQRLSRSVEAKAAINSESSDFAENQRFLLYSLTDKSCSDSNPIYTI